MDQSEDPSFLRSVLASSGDCIKVLDLDANLVFMTEAGQRLMEVSDFNAIRGCPWPDFWQNEGNVAAKAAVATALAGGVGHFQGHTPTMAGNDKYWDVQVTPILGPDGKPEKLLSVSRDITEQKLAQDRQAFLHQELAHRVKNTLTMVQAMARQSFRANVSLDAARESFSARLVALAKANDLLLQSSWTDANLKVLAEAAAEVHGARASRIKLDGPDALVGPKAALSFALALHELGTYAVKYGSLSTDEGRVDVTWRISDGRERNLLFSWVESGGPMISPPTRAGFESRLINRMLSSDLDATVKLEYPPTGLRMTVEGPLAAMQAVEESGGHSPDTALCN